MGTGNKIGVMLAHSQLGGDPFVVMKSSRRHCKGLPPGCVGEAFRGEASPGRAVAEGGSAWPPARSQTLLFLDKSFCQWPADPRVFLTLEERQMWKEKLCLILNGPTSGVFLEEK